LILERGGKIDDGTPRIARALPVFARTVRIRGEERKVHMLKLLGTHALNKADLVAHGFELAQRLIIIEKADVNRGEVALVQHLGNLFAFKRARSHYCGT